MTALIIFFSVLTSISLFIISIIFLGQLGWLDRFESYRRLKTTISMIIRIVDNFSSITRPSSDVGVSVNKNNKSISVEYYEGRHKRIVQIPFSIEKREYMKHWKVYLVVNKSKNINITQGPGIPYMCSAQDMGGREIIAIHNLNEKTLHYRKTTIPYYLEVNKYIDS